MCARHLLEEYFQELMWREVFIFFTRCETSLPGSCVPAGVTMPLASASAFELGCFY